MFQIKNVVKNGKLMKQIQLEKLYCPYCGKKDSVEYVLVDQREKYERKWE